jgi:hypothetical protein
MHPDLIVGKPFPDLTLPDHRHQPTTLSTLARGIAPRYAGDHAGLSCRLSLHGTFFGEC